MGSIEKEDIKFMKEAIKQAQRAYNIKEVPIGAVIVKDGKIIARAYNEKELKQDVTKHAEITAIQKASKKIKNWRLNDCTIYVTLKPCNMCTGAIIQSRIKRIVIGTEYESKGSIESHGIGSCEFGEKVEVTLGIMEKECKEILQSFFSELRK